MLGWAFFAVGEKPEFSSILQLLYFCPSVWDNVLALGAPLTFCRQILILKWAGFCLGPEIKLSPHFLDVGQLAFPVFIRTLEYLHRKVTMEMKSANG